MQVLELIVTALQRRDASAAAPAARGPGIPCELTRYPEPTPPWRFSAVLARILAPRSRRALGIEVNGPLWKADGDAGGGEFIVDRLVELARDVEQQVRRTDEATQGQAEGIVAEGLEDHARGRVDLSRRAAGGYNTIIKAPAKVSSTFAKV